jgi:hypothetical protein
MLDIAPHEILHTLLQARAAVRDELGLLDRRPDSCTSRLIHLLECLEGLADASAQLITLLGEVNGRSDHVRQAYELRSFFLATSERLAWRLDPDLRP